MGEYMLEATPEDVEDVLHRLAKPIDQDDLDDAHKQVDHWLCAYAALLERQAQWPSDSYIDEAMLAYNVDCHSRGDMSNARASAMRAALQAVVPPAHPTLSEALRALEHYAIAGTVVQGEDASRLRATVDEMAPVQASSCTEERPCTPCFIGKGVCEDVNAHWQEQLPVQASAVPDGCMVVPLIKPDEMQALRRFAETTEADESYDVPKDMMTFLSLNGAVTRSARPGWYYLTDYGRMLLAARSAASAQP